MIERDYSSDSVVFGELSRHHRLPKSKTIDGAGRYPIEINDEMHVCWHYIFDNKNPRCICEIINKYFIRKRHKLRCKRRRPNKLTEIDKFKKIKHCSSEREFKINDKMYLYWDIIFNTKNDFDICRIINKYFLDPEWRFVCENRKKYTIKKPYGINKSKEVIA